MTPIFYHPKQSCTSFDFISIKKTSKFAEMATRRAHSDFEPVTRELLYTAHDRSHVDDILSGNASNGFNSTNPDLNVSILYSNGSFVAAAKHALHSGGVACSVSQGFHHAGYEQAWGYCTFNALVVAAQTVCKDARVLILDGDAHFGDGTQDCIDRLQLQSRVVNVSRGDQIGVPIQRNWSAVHWSIWAQELINTHRPDIVFYQAGADAWVGDPYGCGYLTKDGLINRDTGVFTAARQSRIPLVWNLAGGYTDPVVKTVRIHLQTLKASDEVYKCH